MPGFDTDICPFLEQHFRIITSWIE